MKHEWPSWRSFGVAALALTTVLAAPGCGSTNSSATSSVAAATAARSPAAATAAVIAFDRKAAKPTKHYRIAYLAECTSNGYCQARLRGVEAAARKYGFTFQLFDAEFSPQTQFVPSETSPSRTANSLARHEPTGPGYREM